MTARPQRPKFLWNNAYLEKLAVELGDECIFLCLSPVSFRMLTDMTKMLLWATRYEEGAVSELGITAYRELNVPCLEDFYSRLDAIELNNSDWLKSQFDDLGSRMTELEDMNVTQTVNVGCGCDGVATSSSTTNTIDGFTIDPEDTGIVPPYMTDIVNIVDSLQCRSANYLADRILFMLRTMEQLGSGSSTVISIILILVVVVAAISPLLGDEVIAFSALAMWARQLVIMRESTEFLERYFRTLANIIQDDMESLTCALYNWDTAEELGSSLESWLDARIDELQQWEGVPDEVIALLKPFVHMVIGPEMINWFVENVETVVPADFIPQYDCLCGATGDSCPDANLHLSAYGEIPAGDLTGTTQGFASTFNSTTGYYEIIFELAENYCVTIDNATYTPEEMHEVCSSGVMVPSDGSCIRRFAARSGSPFGTAVTFLSQSVDCDCTIPAEATGCKNYGNSYEGEFLSMTSFLTYAEDDYVLMKPDSTVGDPTGVFVDVGYGDILLRELRLNLAKGTDPDDASILRLTVASRDELVSEFVLDIPIASLSAITPSWKIIEFDSFPIAMHPSTGDVDIRFDFLPGTGRARIHEICLDYDMA